MGRPHITYEYLRETIESAGCTLLTPQGDYKTINGTALSIKCKCGTEFTRYFNNWKVHPFCRECNIVANSNGKNVERLALILVAKVIATYQTEDPYEVGLLLEEMLIPRYKGNYDKLYETLANLKIKQTADIERLVNLYKTTVKEYLESNPQFAEDLREDSYYLSMDHK
jgi:hypothetical protein